jgi:hypothetical protein
MQKNSSLWQVLWLCCAVLLVVIRNAHADDDLSGIYTIQGQKGAINLSLRQTAEGLEGSLKGGDLALQLKGLPRTGGGYVGAANSGGQFASYFQVVKEGDKVLFDLVQANADGDPDYTRTTRITFPLQKGTPAGTPDEDTPVADLPVAEENEMPTADADEAPEVPVDEPDVAPATGANFAGQWQGEGLVLDSKAQGNDYIGTLTLNGQKMPFTGSDVNGVLHGTFTADNERFDFQGRLQGNALVISSGETTYRLQKKGSNNPLSKPKNPLAKPNKSAPANPLAKKAPSGTNKNSPVRPTTTKTASQSTLRPSGAPKGGAAWKTFAHPTGLSMRYPPTWTAREAGGMLLLTPPDVKQIGGGPAEVFLVKAEPVTGVTSGDDPRVEQAISAFVAKSFPAFQQTGSTKAIRAGNQPGILMEWQGETQGHPMRLQVLTTVLKNFAVSMVSATAKSEVKASRDAVVRQMFESLVAGAGQKDRQVVGKWFLYSYKGSGSYGRETKSYMTLLPDGTALWGQNSESSFSSANGSFASQGNSGDRGTWSAGKGLLIIAWGDGTTATWQYRVGTTAANRRLFLTGGNGKTDEWMEQ